MLCVVVVWGLLVVLDVVVGDVWGVCLCVVVLVDVLFVVVVGVGGGSGVWWGCGG